MHLYQSLAIPSKLSHTKWEMLDSRTHVTTIETPFDDFQIKFANSERQREAANLLVKKMYSSKGYKVEPVSDGEQHTKTLVVETAGEVIGAMSICMDSENGLPADENYHDKLDELRKHGCKLCEPSRLAIRRTLPHRVFAALIQISYFYSHKIHGCTDYVIEVNPRHVNFYKKNLGFQELGELRICTRVNAPALLLSLNFALFEQSPQRYFIEPEFFKS